jgi:hypothetical protein
MGVNVIDNVFLKDEKLHAIVREVNGNVAQFLSFGFGENIDLRYSYIKNEINSENEDMKTLITKLFNSSKSQSINIRKFRPDSMKGHKLVYGKKLEDIDTVIDILSDNKKNGFYSILNENIDINDGGISGVVLGNVIEFSPNDTPKCVEKPGICSLPKDMGYKLLQIIYGFQPSIDFNNDYRVEFSIHPKRQGIKNEHTIIWEYEKYELNQSEFRLNWPNNFSRFIGDKAYGLLIAHLLALPTPKTTVISRNVAPFTFGQKTGLHEKWIRTCPILKEPGLFYTGDSWKDPFELMSIEETKGSNEINIASILSQDAVDSIYSGAAIIKELADNDIIEGVKGQGDHFMIGKDNIITLPQNIMNEVQKLCNNIRQYYNLLGEVSIEWVYDGNEIWVVQLNQIKVSSSKDYIVKGSPDKYIQFNAQDGLNSLRETINEIKGYNIGIEIIGNIGVTSHYGDLLRLANVPSRICK